MTSKYKLCVECKHYAHRDSKIMQAKEYAHLCMREIRSVDLVTGEEVNKNPTGLFCHAERRGLDPMKFCGLSGYFWEAKDND